MPAITRLHEELARVTLVGRNLNEVLTDITGIARRAMPGSEAASITLIRGDKAFTAAYDGRMALDADELQYERGYGPCMDAGRAGQSFQVDDMRTEQRWPDYAKHAATRSVRSSLSVPLPFQGATIGALNTYSGRPEAFGKDDVAFALDIAGWVALAVGNAEARSPHQRGSVTHGGGHEVSCSHRASQGNLDRAAQAHRGPSLHPSHPCLSTPKPEAQRRRGRTRPHRTLDCAS